MQVDLDKLTSIAESVASGFGLEVLEVKLGQQGRRRSLEITIFRHDGRISLDDCEAVSRKLEAELEQQSEPLFDSSFVLEVQSPGIERKLSTEREYSIFAGYPVDVKTKAKVEGLGCDFTARLVGLSEGRVLLSKPKKNTGPARPKKSMKADADSGPAIPESLAVDMNNLIHVRLHAELPPSGNDANQHGCDISVGMETSQN